MLRRFWLLFAQACTLCLAVLFVVATLRPDLLPRWTGRGNSVVVLQEAAGNAPPAPAPVATYAEAARRAMPAVVNIYSSKAVRKPALDDSLLQRYFPELR
jgi:serine protease DegQ